ncbi:MAG: AAA family ATPase [Oscillospiraceae bacterium]|nr:AAA family ATPase [Oscillospiraceae bacterium]
MLYYHYELGFGTDANGNKIYGCCCSDGSAEIANDKYFNAYSRDGDKLLCVTRIHEKGSTMEVVAAVKVNADGDKDVPEALHDEFPKLRILRRAEITVDEFRRHLDMMNFNGGRKILSKLKLDYRTDGLFNPCPYEWRETVFDALPMKKNECRKRAERILASQSLHQELQRIYSPQNKKAYFGHPVHYLISAGDWGAAQDMYELLLRALASNGRLCSNRVAVFRNFEKGTYRDERYPQHLNACEGGIVVLELCGDPGTGRFASDFYEFTKFTGDLVEKMKKDTLFIFVEIMGKSVKNADALGNILTKADVIQLTEGSGTPEQAVAYLKELAEKSDIAPETPDEVLACLPEKESYSVSDIYSAYHTWYGNGLKNHIYKAYRQQVFEKVEITETVNRPYEELRQMIGLEQVKSVIGQIVSTGKIRCMRELMGLRADAASLNMLFAGNPGTAKTTVARLLAQILKDEDVIRSGRLVECGRQDLVGRYVGWTAKIINEKFREAEGGVLFIDEAYSLVDDSNSFGAEAINTITQLMENYRERVIVIFAGYPEKMKTFLDQNEGLRSRISFHLNFPDYNPEELLEILRFHAGKREYTIAEDAIPAIREILSDAVCQENYGNGRYVRNLLEQAIIRQSSRLYNLDPEQKLTAAEMCLLRAEDFAPVTLGIAEAAHPQIGFAV